ncbi:MULTISPECIES: hypothetical protein [Anoxybacillaceae]|uniref:hypothetical protein n=1 Tax=Anoxybacillaceae TaxID=3120669 RepID=UPI00351BC43C
MDAPLVEKDHYAVCACFLVMSSFVLQKKRSATIWKTIIMRKSICQKGRKKKKRNDP